MSFLWDSNILRHYLSDHPQLLENLTRVERRDVFLPVVVAAEQLRGRTDALLKAESTKLAQMQWLLRQTFSLLGKFPILYFDESALALAEHLIKQSKTKRRYADVLIAAQALAGQYILVTRNLKDFRDLLPPAQLQNWVDDKLT